MARSPAGGSFVIFTPACTDTGVAAGAGAPRDRCPALPRRERHSAMQGQGPGREASPEGWRLGTQGWAWRSSTACVRSRARGTRHCGTAVGHPSVSHVPCAPPTWPRSLGCAPSAPPSSPHLKSGSVFSGLMPSQIFSREVIQEGARWQFWGQEGSGARVVVRHSTGRLAAPLSAPAANLQQDPGPGLAG